MNPVIPSSHYLLLDKQLSLDTILDNMYHQISIFKNHKFYKSGDINFELEFRLRNKYTNIDINDFIKCMSCRYHEYLFKENKTTRYRIICESSYPTNIDDDQDINLENEEENKKEEEKEEENIENKKISKLYTYVDTNSEKEITETLNGKVEFTKKMTLMTAYYFVYKIVLSIETNLDVSDIVSFLDNGLVETEKGYNKKIKTNKGLNILQFITPTIKYRKSYILHKDVRIDVTKYEDKSQFEIDFSRNINHERSDMINIVHDIMLLLDCSNFVLDYLFYLLPNFEFQKPITPSLDTIFDIADDLVKNTFFVAAKTDGLRRLVIIINHLMFSVSENFEVEYIDCINSDLHLVFDCEFVNDDFIPFDILYHDVDLRLKSYKERIAILDSLNFDSFKDKFKRKKIRKCGNYSDLQNFIENEMENENKILVPNDGIIITDGASTYTLQNIIPFDSHRVEHIRVYKIKTRNTIDLRFDGRYFYAKQHSIKKSNLKLTLAEFKKICLKYHQHKKLNRDKNKSITYYRKKVDIINDTPFNKRIVYYQLVKEKKIPFIIEFDLDNGVFVKEREDKWTSNSLNTFNSIVLASFQKVNIEIFSPDSNILMRKYHNRIKQNILNEYKGNLLDIGSGNGGDIHKWKHFRKIACVEPDDEKLKNLKDRIKKSNINNRITIYPNTIQNVKLKDSFNIATCFFALNDFNYSDIESMLNNINQNINGKFIVLFMDYRLFNSDINSHCMQYRQCIDTQKNKFLDSLDKESPVYLLGTLRYAHKECDNIMFVNIENSNLTDHYENAINSEKVITIFEKYKFNMISQYSVAPFSFLNSSQKLYTSYLKVIEFSNLKN